MTRNSTVFYESGDDLLERARTLKAQLLREKKVFEHTLMKFGREGLDMIKQQGMTEDQFFNKSRGIISDLKKLENHQYELPKIRNALNGTDRWHRTDDDQVRVQNFLDAGFEDLCLRLVSFVDDRESDYNTAKNILGQINSYALLGKIVERIRAIRDEQSLLFLSDHTALIHDLVKGEDTPFLFEKMGTWYDYIFIDEFQDTSVFQWENLLHLVQNSLASFNDVLVVGDVKQSIYRWRGGDFNLLESRVQSDLAVFEEMTEVITLPVNYRSAPEVVEFNNRFFPFAARRLEAHAGTGPGILSRVYGSLSQEANSRDKGYVRIQVFDRGHEVLGEVLKAIQDVRKRGYAWKDIMILTRRNNEADAAAAFLMNQQVPVISQSSMLLKNVPAVQMLVSLISLVNDQRDEVSRLNVLRWMSEFGGKTWEHRRIEQAIPDWNAFLSLCPSQFGKQYHELERLPIYELAEELSIMFNLEKQDQVLLQQFKEIILQKNLRGIADPGSFLEWWEQDKEELKASASVSADAVQVMTIHRSKGLEAPVVILPNANFGLGPQSRAHIFWTSDLDETSFGEYELLPLKYRSPEEVSEFTHIMLQEYLETLLEGLNQAYVAFTRAAKELHLISEKPRQNSESLYTLLMEFMSMSGSGEEAAGVWETGEPTAPLFLGEDREETLPLIPVPGNRIWDHVSIRNQSSGYFLLGDSKASRQIERGNKRHLILEHLQDPRQLDLVVESLVREGLLSLEEAASYAEDMRSLFENQQFASWFDARWSVLAEREILSDGRIYKPDRVIFTEEETLVIDYKKEVEEATHEHQISHYASLLGKMGFKNIRKFLVYLDQLKIKEVS